MNVGRGYIRNIGRGYVIQNSESVGESVTKVGIELLGQLINVSIFLMKDIHHENKELFLVCLFDHDNLTHLHCRTKSTQFVTNLISRQNTKLSAKVFSSSPCRVFSYFITADCEKSMKLLKDDIVGSNSTHRLHCGLFQKAHAALQSHGRGSSMHASTLILTLEC